MKVGGTSPLPNAELPREVVDKITEEYLLSVRKTDKPVNVQREIMVLIQVTNPNSSLRDRFNYIAEKTETILLKQADEHKSVVRLNFREISKYNHDIFEDNITSIQFVEKTALEKIDKLREQTLLKETAKDVTKLNGVAMNRFIEESVRIENSHALEQNNLVPLFTAMTRLKTAIENLDYNKMKREYKSNSNSNSNSD